MVAARDPKISLPEYAVTAAHPEDLWTFLPIAAGCFPGRHQTVVQAELVAAAAAAAAFHEATQRQIEFCVWSDNERVVSLLQNMFASPDRIWGSKMPNHDLINSLACEFRQAAHFVINKAIGILAQLKDSVSWGIPPRMHLHPKLFRPSQP